MWRIKFWIWVSLGFRSKPNKTQTKTSGCASHKSQFQFQSFNMYPSFFSTRLSASAPTVSWPSNHPAEPQDIPNRLQLHLLGPQERLLRVRVVQRLLPVCIGQADRRALQPGAQQLARLRPVVDAPERPVRRADSAPDGGLGRRGQVWVALQSQVPEEDLDRRSGPRNRFSHARKRSERGKGASSQLLWSASNRDG